MQVKWAKKDLNIMRLTDSKIRTAKPAPKTFRMSDGGGLYLEITPSGTKTFRFGYYRPDDGKRGWMNFGLYPGTKLTEARDQRDVCRVKVHQPVWRNGAGDPRD
jgi:hypothetical protein